MGFLQKYRYQILFKIIAVLAVGLFYSIYVNNYSICPQVRQVECIGNQTLPANTGIIPQEYKCTSVEDQECCRHIYPGNQQCYNEAVKRSIFAGFTGSGLIIFAEFFYLIALLIYTIFPFLTRFVVKGPYIGSGAQEAAFLSSDVFAKAIYFITPLLQIIILFVLYRNLPFFI